MNSFCVNRERSRTVWCDLRGQIWLLYRYMLWLYTAGEHTLQTEQHCSFVDAWRVLFKAVTFFSCSISVAYFYLSLTGKRLAGWLGDVLHSTEAWMAAKPTGEIKWGQRGARALGSPAGKLQRWESTRCWFEVRRLFERRPLFVQIILHNQDLCRIYLEDDTHKCLCRNTLSNYNDRDNQAFIWSKVFISECGLVFTNVFIWTGYFLRTSVYSTARVSCALVTRNMSDSWRSLSSSETCRCSRLSSMGTCGEAMWQKPVRARWSSTPLLSMAIPNTSWELPVCSEASPAPFTRPTTRKFPRHPALPRETNCTNSLTTWITGTTLAVATEAHQ